MGLFRIQPHCTVTNPSQQLPPYWSSQKAPTNPLGADAATLGRPCRSRFRHCSGVITTLLLRRCSLTCLDRILLDIKRRSRVRTSRSHTRIGALVMGTAEQDPVITPLVRQYSWKAEEERPDDPLCLSDGCCGEGEGSRRAEGAERSARLAEMASVCRAAKVR